MIALWAALFVACLVASYVVGHMNGYLQGYKETGAALQMLRRELEELGELHRVRREQDRRIEELRRGMFGAN